MPLIDLKTNLKSLKYGHDRPGGGNSGQPYETVDINAIDQGLESPLFRNGDDGLIRGGFDGAFKSSVIDARRINKLLKDAPKGPLWIARQVGLQLSNPKLEVKKINTGSGLLNTIVNFAQDKIGLIPTRIYNLGFNTLAQVPVNAFGVHFNRHGLLPVQDENTKYLAVVQHNNEGDGAPNNRLVGYKNKFSLGDKKYNSNAITSRSRFVGSLFNILSQLSPLRFAPKDLTIENYLGGPGSSYGVGNTLIKRYSFTEDNQKITFADDKSRTIAGRARNLNNNVINALDKKTDLTQGGPSVQVYGSTALARFSTIPALKTYQQIKKQNDTQATKGVFRFNPFKNTANLGAGGFDFYNGEINSYTNNNIEYKNGIDATLKLNGSWKSLNREKRVGSGRQDQINLTPLFTSQAGTINDRILIDGFGYKEIRDLCKFRIQAINTDTPDIATWMIFRAYLTQFTDNVDATWNDVKYVGRGESFYIYSGFIRKINIGFKVAALSEKEMKPMYQKLNYLMGNLMPDYSKNENGIMRGPLVRMTVGNWIDGQAGIINSLNYTVPQDSPWEIALAEPILGEKKLILPHIIEVNMTFTPIGSQTGINNKISEKSAGTSHIAQNINDYQYIGEEVTSTSDLTILEGTETRKELISAAPIPRRTSPSSTALTPNVPDLTRRDPLNVRNPIISPAEIQFTDRSQRAGSPLNQPVNIPKLPTPSIIRGGG